MKETFRTTLTPCIIIYIYIYIYIYIVIIYCHIGVWNRPITLLDWYHVISIYIPIFPIYIRKQCSLAKHFIFPTEEFPSKSCNNCKSIIASQISIKLYDGPMVQVLPVMSFMMWLFIPLEAHFLSTNFLNFFSKLISLFLFSVLYS